MFRWANRAVAEVCGRALATADDIEVFVPHQANMRITDAVVKAMGLPAPVEVARTVRDDGNVSGASIPLALDTLIASGREHSS